MDIKIRNAELKDLECLIEISNRDRLLYEDRIKEVLEGDFLQFFVVEVDEQVVGFSCLVWKQPPKWSPRHPLPQIIDLNILEQRRGQGIGSRFINYMVNLAKEKGYDRLHIGADMEINPRALYLYKRLGFIQLHDQPRVEKWKFVDSQGKVFEGQDLVIYLDRVL